RSIHSTANRLGGTTSYSVVSCRGARRTTTVARRSVCSAAICATQAGNTHGPLKRCSVRSSTSTYLRWIRSGSCTKSSAISKATSGVWGAAYPFPRTGRYVGRRLQNAGGTPSRGSHPPPYHHHHPTPHPPGLKSRSRGGTLTTIQCKPPPTLQP